MRNLRLRLGLTTGEMRLQLAQTMGEEIPDDPQARSRWANQITKWEMGYHMPAADVYLAVLDLAGIGADVTAISEGESALPKNTDPRIAGLERELQQMRGTVNAILDQRLRGMSFPIAEGPEANYMTIQEAAEALSTSRGTIYNHLKRGTLHGFRLGARTLIPRRDVNLLRNGGSAD